MCCLHGRCTRLIDRCSLMPSICHRTRLIVLTFLTQQSETLEVLRGFHLAVNNACQNMILSQHTSARTLKLRCVLLLRQGKIVSVTLRSVCPLRMAVQPVHRPASVAFEGYASCARLQRRQQKPFSVCSASNPPRCNVTPQTQLSRRHVLSLSTVLGLSLSRYERNICLLLSCCK